MPNFLLKCLRREQPDALLMRVYLQRAGYSLQQDGTLTRPADDKRKEYFDAVITEWTAFQIKVIMVFMMAVMWNCSRVIREVF